MTYFFKNSSSPFLNFKKENSSKMKVILALISNGNFKKKTNYTYMYFVSFRISEPQFKKPRL